MIGRAVCAPLGALTATRCVYWRLKPARNQLLMLEEQVCECVYVCIEIQTEKVHIRINTNIPTLISTGRCLMQANIDARLRFLNWNVLRFCTSCFDSSSIPYDIIMRKFCSK